MYEHQIMTNLAKAIRDGDTVAIEDIRAECEGLMEMDYEKDARRDLIDAILEMLYGME